MIAMQSMQSPSPSRIEEAEALEMDPEKTG
jgi:hypothetical protein